MDGIIESNMPGDDMSSERGDTRQPAVESQKGLEILDFENHGALYGRFLLASQAKTEEEAANIIDPNKTVSLLRDLQIKDNALTLEKRNYNFVAEKSSLAERKEEWKGIEYSEAYNQWRTEFTGFMTTRITPDSNRELALMIIMSDPKTAAEFTVDNADTLFKKFCDGGSDIDKFIKQVTTSLARDVKIASLRDVKIASEDLRKLLPDLEWIASGLFGKETASNVVTRLIELESELFNNRYNPQTVLNAVLNKKRINKPKDDEKQILNALYRGEIPSLTPQEKIIPTEEIKVTVPIVPGEGVSKPAPVITESDEDKKRRLGITPPPPPTFAKPETGPTSAAEALRKEMEAAAARMRQQQNRGPAAEALTNRLDPPGPKVEAPAASANTAAEELERELASLRKLFAAPHPPQGGITAPPVPRAGAPRVADSQGLAPPLPDIVPSETLPAVYTGRLYLMFPGSINEAGLNSVWEVLEEVAGMGAIVDTQFISRKAGIQFTVELGNRQLVLEELQKRMPGSGMTGLAPDRLKVDWVTPRVRVADGETLVRPPPAGESSQQSPVISEVKAGEEEPIPGFVVTPIEGSDKFQIELNGKDTELKWEKVGGGREYQAPIDLGDSLLNPDKFPESLDLPKGVAMSVQVGEYGTVDGTVDRRRYGETDKTRMFQIIGTQNTKVPLGRNVYGIWLYTEIPEEIRALKTGKLYEVNKEEPIDLADFKKLLNPQAPAKLDLAPNAATASVPRPEIAAPEPTETTTAENIINMERIFPDDLLIELNERLSRNKDKSHITFSFLPVQVKDYMISLAEGFYIKGGNIKVDKDNQVIVSDLRITKSGVGVTLDLVLSNDKDGIRADITKFHRDLMLIANKASSRAEVERQIKNINFTIKKRLDEETSKDNPEWKTKKVSILDGKVLIRFEKLPEAETPAKREQPPDLTELRRISNKPFLLADQSFFATSREKRYDMTTGFFSEDGGETK